MPHKRRQPGDNYRVAAAGEKAFLLELENNDEKQNLGANTKQRNGNKQRIVTTSMIHPNNPASVAQAEIRKAGNYASDVLTTWRLVHVEVDSMLEACLLLAARLWWIFKLGTGAEKSCGWRPKKQILLPAFG